MHKVLISIPDQLISRMKTTIPERQRSKIITALLESEVLRREKALFECALAVQNDAALNADMAAWEETISDGIGDEIAPKKSKKDRLK